MALPRWISLPGWRGVRWGWVVVGSVLLINGLTYATVTHAHWDRVGRHREAAGEVRQAREQLTARMDRFGSTYGHVVETGVDLGRFLGTVDGTGRSVATMTEAIQGLIQASGLRIERMRFSDRELPELGVVEIMADIPVRGTYFELRRFVSLLRVEPLFVVLEEVAISEQEGDGSGELSIDLALSGFLLARNASSPWLDAMETGSSTDDDPGSTLPADPLVAQRMALQRASRLRERLEELRPIGDTHEIPAIHLERLAEAGGMPAATRRDLFSFATSAPERAPADLYREADPAAGAPPERPQARSTDPASGPTPLQPPFRLLGLIRVGDRAMATLSHRGEVLVVPEGATVLGEYVVAEVGFDFVRIEAGSRQAILEVKR